MITRNATMAAGSGPVLALVLLLSSRGAADDLPARAQLAVACERSGAYTKWAQWSPRGDTQLIVEELQNQLRAALSKYDNGVGSTSNAPRVRALLAHLLRELKARACKPFSKADSCGWVTSAAERERVKLDADSAASVAALVWRVFSSQSAERLCSVDRFEDL